MQRSTRARRPPKHPDARGTRNAAGATPPKAHEAAPDAPPVPAPKGPNKPAAPSAAPAGGRGPTREPTPEVVVEYFIRGASVALHIAESDWGNVVFHNEASERTPIGQVWLAVFRAIVALVRLLEAWDTHTPEGDALLEAARVLGDVRERFEPEPYGLEAAAELPPTAPTVAPSSPTAPTPRLSPASSCAERLESLLTDIAGHARTIDGAIGEARAEIEAAAPPASRATYLATAALLRELEHAEPGFPLGSTPRPLSASDLADLRIQVDDIASAGLDAVDAPSRRRLGRRTARATILAAYRKARAIFAIAGEGPSPASPGGLL